MSYHLGNGLAALSGKQIIGVQCGGMGWGREAEDTTDSGGSGLWKGNRWHWPYLGGDKDETNWFWQVFIIFQICFFSFYSPVGWEKEEGAEGRKKERLVVSMIIFAEAFLFF